MDKYTVTIIVMLCYTLGLIIKKSLPCIPNKYIPLIMGITGVFMNIWINQWSLTPDILLGGLASGLASTGMNELARGVVQNESK